MLLTVIGVYCAGVGLVCLAQIPLGGSSAFIAGVLHFAGVAMVVSIHKFAKSGMYNFAKIIAYILAGSFATLLVVLLVDGSLDLFIGFVLLFGTFCSCRVAYEISLAEKAGAP